MIELTPEQRQAINEQHGEPVHLVDPSTHDAYVLMRAEMFERMAGVLSSAGEEVSPLIQPAMLRAQQTFWRELPQLMQKKRNHGQWFACHGDRRVGLGKTRTELYQHCLQQGLERGTFYIGKIKETLVPPWVPTPLEESLYEFTDDSACPPQVP